MEYNCEGNRNFNFEKFQCCLCVIHGKIMVWHISYMYTIKKWKNIYVTKNIDFHSYVMNIYNFGSKHLYDLHKPFKITSFFNFFFFLLVENEGWIERLNECTIVTDDLQP
jgi:hypothetical protein